MPYKLTRWTAIEFYSHLKVIGCCFLLSFFAASCNQQSNKEMTAEPKVIIDSTMLSSEISYDDLKVLVNDTTKVNWLGTTAWDTVSIDANPDVKAEIYMKMEKIRYYLSGAIAEYNMLNRGVDPNVPYEVKEFKYAMKSRSPLQFTIIAFLNPPATKPEHDHDDRPGPGGHIIPPPPPPPGK